MTRRPIVRSTKYGAMPTEVDGITFASKAEARRYGELRLLKTAGAIGMLELQPRFPLIVNGVLVAEYRADFRYWDHERGRFIVEDVKSKPTMTPLYRLKKKLVRALHGVDITEVEA